MSDNKYTITHAARIATVQDGVIRTTLIGTLADATHALQLSNFSGLTESEEGSAPSYEGERKGVVSIFRGGSTNVPQIGVLCFST